MWEVKHKKRFYKELAKIPLPTRKEIEEIAFGEEIKENPFQLGRIEKLTGYRNYFKISFGEYRVGLKIDKKSNTVEFRRALHRKDIYRKFP
ncbi:unnamed protein product [marine sediment metagenome]|uniref:Uncharacterized protein n=1 Tax=marine sediment metagenome TaxID=412755 RepID=X1H4V5_9ZZZZ